MTEKYVRLVQDMYRECVTSVKCAVGLTSDFKVEAGLHQGSALSPFLFALVMERLTEEALTESPWTMMFADDIVLARDNRNEIE